MIRGIRLLWQLRGPVTFATCRAFGSGAFTTFFYDLGLSNLGFKHTTFRFREERSSPLRHLGRHAVLIVYMYIAFNTGTVILTTVYNGVLAL